MKTNQKSKLITTCAALLSLCAVVLPASGAILKLDNVNSLTDPASWTGGVAPGSGDVAQFDTQGTGAYATANTWLLGASTSWAGIQVLSPTNSLTITNDGSALTLGAGGFDLSAGSNSFTFYPDITVVGPQVWNITNSRTLTVFGSITGAAGTNALDIVKMGGGTLNIRSSGVLLRATQTALVSNATMNIYAPISDGGSGYGITKNGAGSLSLRGTNTFTGPITVNQATLSLETNASTTAASLVTVNTGGSFTVNAGGMVNGSVLIHSNTAVNSVNCTVNGTIVGNATTDPAVTNGVAIPLTPQNAVYTPAAPFGYINVNGGGSLAAGGYITNNGVVKFSGSDVPVTFGTFVMTNGLGGIWDANRTPKTFTFPNNSSLAYFKCDSNEVSTLQIAGNGTCNIRWLGYNDANTATPQLWSYTNTFNGGTWIIGNIGQNNSSSHYVGVANIINGANMTVTNLGGSGSSPGGTHGTWNVINGSLTFWAQVAEAHAAGNAGLTINVNNSGGGPGTFTITNGGFNIGFAAVNTAPENNALNIGAGGVANIKGTVQVGTSTASPNAETNAINLSGGKLVINGTLQSIALAGAQDHLFTWTGGQLTAQTITTSAGFNDPASSISPTTVSNTAGILAPGDLGTAGRTTITGNYVQTSGGTLAVDIGGTYQSGNVFQAGPTNYDFVSVSGSASVAGAINVNLINGYTPAAATTTFTILSATGGLTTSPLGYNGFIPVYTNGVLYGGKYFQAVVSGNNLLLTNYGVAVSALAAKFTPTNTIGVAPAAKTFTDLSTGVITNRHWNFGDGTTLDTLNTSVAHTYNAIGKYTNVLTVTALGGATSSATGVVTATASAVSLTWVGGLSGNVWDTSTKNWLLDGITSSSYADPDYVTFDDSGSVSPAVNLTFTAQPSSLVFNNASLNYTIGGSGQIAGATDITLNGGGSVTLLTTNATFTGPTVINAGTLQIGNGVASGAIDGTTAVTDNGALIFNQGDTHSLGAVITGYGALTKLGAGALTLGADNSSTFSGPVTVAGGTLAGASFGSLGTGSLTISNATLQVGTGGTLNQALTLEGTNVTLNVNGTVILPNAIAGGTPVVTVGGTGTLQIDSGGASVSLPTNVVLNGGSLNYYRSDNYTQPGTISASSVNSSVAVSGIAAGATNIITLADGLNTFNNLYNNSAGVVVLDASANSSNYVAGTAGGAFGVNNSAVGADLIINGGNYFVTNAPLFGTIGGGVFHSSIVLNGGTLNSSYYGTAAATDGGAHFLRCNLEMNGGTFHVSAWGLAFTVANPNGTAAQTFTLNNGTVLVDDSNTTPGATSATTFYGLNVGNHSFANDPVSYCGNATVVQNGGQVILAGSTNNNLELGASYLATNAKGAKTATYTLAGGTLSLHGGSNGGNVHLGGSTDGASTATLILTNTGKLVASGTISGYANGAAEVQVFSFLGGTLVASNINVTDLSDVAGNPTGTLVNGGGTLAPGDLGVAGKTTITGNYSASATATLQVDINGATAANAFTNSGAFYDTVAVSGTATLGGNLLVHTNGTALLASSTFPILTAGSVSGTFANVTGGRVSVVGSTNTFGVIYTANSVILTNYSGATGGVAPSPAPITYSLNGSSLQLSWPNGQGWRLEVQTNNLATGLGTNWFDTGATSPFTNTVNPANATVFYRLVYP